MKNLSCLIVDDEPLARRGLSDFVGRSENLYVSAECRNAKEALLFLKEHDVDVIFLDIEMPGIKGIDMLEDMKVRPAVVLVTAYPSYAVKGFDLDVQDYLLKPVAIDRFQQAIRKCREYIDANDNAASLRDSVVYLRSEGKMYNIHLHDILYIQALQNYVQCYTKEQKFIVHLTMKSMQEQLPEAMFCRTHRSYIINMKNIDRITGNIVEIDGNKIPVSRNFSKEFYRKIQNYQIIR